MTEILAGFRSTITGLTMQTPIACRLLLCICAVALIAQPLPGQQIVVSKDNRTIAVTTSADATAVADTATVHIGFLVYGEDEQAAYASGSKVSNAIAKALADDGVAPEAIESESQSIAPVQQYGNAEWTPEERVQRKFQVQQSWTVKTSAKNASMVLDTAIKAGANQSGQIDWGLGDENGLTSNAARLALERARAIAEQMAQGLKTTLGQLVYASNEAPPRVVEPTMRFAQAAPTVNGKVAPLSVSAPKVTRSATVYAVFAIQ